MSEYKHLSIFLLLIIIFSYCSIFLNGTISEKVFTTLVPALTSMPISLICIHTFSLIVNDSRESHESILVLFFSKLGFFIVCEMIVKLKRKSFSLTPFQWALQISCYIISFSIASILWKISAGDPLNGGAYLCIYIMLALLNVFLFIMLIIIQKGAEERLEKTALQTELDNRIMLISEVEKKYSEIKILRHDMKHYLSSLSELISENKLQKAQDYLGEILQQKMMPAREAEYTGSSIVDAVLCEKQTVCNQNRIELKTQIDTEFGDISELDLSVIIANLFDNAIKGCEGSSNPKIRFLLKRMKAYLKIEFTNSVETEVLSQNPSLETTRSDKENHGYGIKSVKNIAEKYGGKVMFTEDDKTFTVVVILKVDYQP